jgi:DNA-binding transcriptional LysR family regulator
VRAAGLLDPARDALARATRVLSAPLPFEPATARGRVTVAMTEELQAMIGGRLLRRLRARAPGLDVRLRAAGDATVDEGRRGIVDVAVSPILPTGMPDLSDFVVRPLYERRFQTVTRRRRRLGLDAFCRADHLLVAPGGREGGYVDDSLARIGRSRRVAVTVLSFSSALALIAADDDLVTTLPDDVVKVLGVGLRRKLHVQRCPVETPVMPVALIWHATRTRDSQLRFVIDVVGGAVADALGVTPPTRLRG